MGVIAGYKTIDLLQFNQVYPTENNTFFFINSTADPNGTNLSKENYYGISL